MAWRSGDLAPLVTVPKHDLRDLFKALDFAKVKLINYMDPLETNVGASPCAVKCTATPPPVVWLRVSGEAILKPFHVDEDIQKYDKALREQLPVFQVQVKVVDKEAPKDDDLLAPVHNARQDIEVKFAFNPTRLAHRALGFLPSIRKRLDKPDPTVRLSASTEPGYADSLVLGLNPFSKSIRALPIDGLKSRQPPSFQDGLKLEPEQRVTVQWMVDRETRPAAFTEREVEEEIIPHLQLRLVGRAERNITCGGGIIADDVGFGKTVMTIALMDLQRQHDDTAYESRKLAEENHGLVPLNCTLIIVPSHIVDQWMNEISRFLGPDTKKKLVMVKHWRQLERPRPDILSTARIVVVSDTVFTEPKYMARLSHWAGKASPGWNGTRMKTRLGHRNPKWTRGYQDWHEDCTAKIADHQGRFMADPGAYEELIADIQEQFHESEARDKSLFDAKTKASVPDGDDPEEGEDDEKEKKKKKKEYPLQTPQPMDSRMFTEQEVMFEFCSWSRIVWDECSYKNAVVAKFVSDAYAPHKWLLSGTPPKQNLADVDYMAKCIEIHIARDVDLRMGHSPVTRGPSKSLRTEAEEFCSFGRMKSDKFVQERHRQGELCLQTVSCSNKAPQVNIAVHEQVVVCCSPIVEKAFYQDQQQEWRRAEMRHERIPEDILKEILATVGHKCGQDMPQALAAVALIHAASLPDLSDQTLADLRERREQRLHNVEKYLKPLFEKTLWLTQHLEHCSKVKDRLGSTATLRRLAAGLQSGRFDIFDGEDNYIVVLKALFPALDVAKQESNILQLARDPAGIDLIQLRSNIVAPCTNSDDVLATLHRLNCFSWDQFYNLDLETAKTLSNKNVMELYTQYIAKHNPSGLSPADLELHLQEAKSMELVELQTRLEPVVAQVQKKQAQGRKRLSQKFVDEVNGLSTKGLDHMCQLRGLKPPSSTKKPGVQKVVMEDERGGAGQSNYNKPNVRALFPADQVPLLDETVKVRNSTVSSTHNELTGTIHKLSQGIENLTTCADQLRRAKMFERLEQTGQLACDVCHGQDDLHVVFECGHVLCRNDREGKEYCGDGGGQCPSLLRLNLIPVTKLHNMNRNLEFSPGFFKSSRPDMAHDSGKRKRDEATDSSSTASKKVKVSGNTTTSRSSTTKNKASESKASSSKASQSKASNSKASQSKASNSKASQTKASQSKASQTKASQSKASQSKASQSNASNIKSSQTKASQAKASQTKASNSKASKRKASKKNEEKEAEEEEEKANSQEETENVPTKPKTVSSKIKSIVDLVEKIPQDNYIVLFSQFDAMLLAIQEALQDKGISCAMIIDNNNDATQASATLESFKQGDFRVLALNQASSTAAGSNLTIANHVIFATPFLADCQETYDSTMKQAIGRCNRRGQKNDVHVYHFVTDETIEVDLLEARAKKLVRIQPGQAVGGILPRRRRKDRNEPEQLLESEEQIKARSFWYKDAAGPLERVNSILTRQEVWNAMDETDYLVTIGFEDEEKHDASITGVDEKEERLGTSAV